MRRIIFFFLLTGLMSPVFSQLSMSKNPTGWGLQNTKGEWIFKPDNDTILRFTINDSLGLVNTFYLGIKGELGTTICDESNEFLDDPFFTGGDFLLTDSSGSKVYTISDLYISFALLGDLPYTRQVSINKNPCYLRRELGIIYDRVYSSDFLARKGNFYGIINHKPGLKAVVDLVYDTVIVNSYPVKYYSCRSKGKYDYYLENGKKINDTPADTLYEFYLWTTGPEGTIEINDKRLFCLVTGSKTVSVPFIKTTNEIGYNPETGEEESYIIRSTADLPKIAGGSMKLYNGKFELLEENVEDLAISYQFDRYEEESSGPTDYIFHILSQNDTTNVVRREDSFYRTPEKISPNSIGAVRKNGEWKVYNMTNYKAIPGLRFSGEHLQRIKKAAGTWAMRSGGRICLFDTNGVFLNECDYDDISNFTQVNFGNDSVPQFKNIAHFKKNGKWGLVDDKGKLLLKPGYAGISQTTHGTYLVNTNGELKYVTRKETIPARYTYDALNGAPPKLNPSFISEIRDSFYVGGNFGVLTLKGSVLIPAQYSCIVATDTGYVAFKGGKEIIRQIPFAVANSDGNYDNMLYYEKPIGGKVIYFDMNGQKIKELDSYYTGVGNYYGIPKYLIREKNGKFGLSATDYTEIISPVYDSLKYQDINSVKTFLIADRKGKKGIINELGSIIAPFEYVFVKNYVGKFIAAKENAPEEIVSMVETIEGPFSYSDYIFTKEKGTVLDTSGEIIMQGIDSMISSKTEGMGPENIDVYKNGKKGFLSYAGFLPPEYDAYYHNYAYNGYITKNSDKYGAVSARGLKLEPFADTAYFVADFLFYSKNGKTGVFHIDGRELLKAEWKKVTWQDRPDYFFVVQGDNGTGIFPESKSELVIPARYDSIDLSMSGYEAKIIKCWKNGLVELFSLAMNKKMTDTQFEDFSEDYWTFRGKVNGKWGLYSQSAQEIVPPQYSSILYAEDQRVYMLDKDGTKTFLNKDFEKAEDGKEKWEKSMMRRFSESSAKKISSFTWKSANGPVGCDATAFLMDTDRTWWLGTGSSGGVFISRDQGQTWQERNNGIGPVHVLDIGKFRDTIFISTAVSGSGDLLNYYPVEKANDEWKNYKDMFYFNSKTNAWIKVGDKYAKFLRDTLSNLMHSEVEGEIYFETELEKANTSIDPVVIYRYDKNGNLKDSVPSRLSMDFDLNGKKNVYDNKMFVPAKSGLYIVDFKTKKVERAGFNGMIATDITKIHPLSDEEVLVVTGTNAIWKIQSGKWNRIFDYWNNADNIKRVYNNIDYSTISWNTKNEGLFMAEGNIYKISADGSKVELVYKDKSPDAKNNACSWNGTNSFYLLYDKFNSDYSKKVEVIDINSKKILSSDSSGYFYSCKGYFQDSEGKTWRMNYDNIYRLDDSANTYLEDQAGEIERSFFFFGKGDVIVSHRDGKKIYIWSNVAGKWNTFYFPGNAEINAITVDNNNRILFSTNYAYTSFGCGGRSYTGPSKLYYLKFNGSQFDAVEIENKINPRVISLAPHPLGGVWVGTCGSGLYHLKY